MDAFAATRLAIGAGFLVVAAAMDVRTRRVRDPLWIGLGTIGLILIATELALANATWEDWSLIASGAILFYTVFFGRPLFDEEGFRVRPRRVLVFAGAAALFFLPLGAASAGSGRSSAELASMPVMILVYQAFYRARLLHGGADAKGLIALTMLLPTYPDASPFPVLAPDPRVQSLIRVIFPFSLVVWVDAAILALAIPLGLFLYNAARGDLAFPHAFLGYRARLDPFPKHAWLMERITAAGEHVLVLFPRRGEDPAAEITKLRSAGIERAWVTPQTPFMVPLLLGFLLAFLAGNLLIGILGAAR
ncbi:MAG TPA: A24 family peptidase C-terminal domain-containing protein [Thermoplasmata archaeon]|nr:A24 family peptidase C-terminal domain-containing protein [Thermoplasmata archaeon]